MKTLFFLSLLFLAACGNNKPGLREKVNNQCHFMTLPFDYYTNGFERLKSEGLLKILRTEELCTPLRFNQVLFCASCRDEENRNEAIKLAEEFSSLSSEMRLILLADSLSIVKVNALEKILFRMHTIVKKIDKMPVQD